MLRRLLATMFASVVGRLSLARVSATITLLSMFERCDVQGLGTGADDYRGTSRSRGPRKKSCSAIYPRGALGLMAGSPALRRLVSATGPSESCSVTFLEVRPVERHQLL
jgi:hypothetical protein